VLVLPVERLENRTTTHDTSLSVEVGEDLLLKGGLVAVAGSDGDTEGDGLLLGLAGDVLVDGDRRVDASALKEEGSDGSAGTLGGNEDDIDVRGDLDLGLKGKRSVRLMQSEYRPLTSSL